MIREAIEDRLEAVRDLSPEDILSALGFERKRSALDFLLPAAGIFVASAALGAGVALLLAPKSGRQMRRAVKAKGSELTDRVTASADQLVQEARGLRLHAPRPVARKPDSANGASKAVGKKSPDASRRPLELQSGRRLLGSDSCTSGPSPAKHPGGPR